MEKCSLIAWSQFAKVLGISQLWIVAVHSVKKGIVHAHAAYRQSHMGALAVLDGVNYSNDRALSLTNYVRHSLHQR